MRARLGADPSSRLPDAGVRPGASSPRRRGPFGPWQLGGRPLSRAWAAPALLSVALAVVLGAALKPAATAPGEYHALAAPVDAGATAVVRFHADATEAQIRRSLNESGARLVDGPTVTDAYVVRLPRDRYAASLDRLRRQPAVALVEALETATSP
jgi:hypothetical protein